MTGYGLEAGRPTVEPFYCPLRKGGDPALTPRNVRGQQRRQIGEQLRS